MTITLYHFPPSLCSQKVRLALAEKGVEWEGRIVDIGPAMENYEGWYARINPGMVVPTLVHDEHVVTDSARIVRYIDASFEGPSLTPGNARKRAVMDEWIDRQDAFPFRELSYATFPGVLGWVVTKSFEKRRGALRRGLEENPELGPLYEARLRDIDEWEATVSNARSVDALERRIQGLVSEFSGQLSDRAFVVGDDYTLADVVWTVILARLKQLQLDTLWDDRIGHYYDRMRRRPSFEEADIWESKRPLELVPRILRSLIRRGTS